MIIDCIADLHGYYPKLEGGDLLIVAGDLTARHTEKEWHEFATWLDKQDYKKIVFIAGNHDIMIEKWDKEQDAEGYQGPVSDTNDRIEYLCDSGTEFEGFKIWGFPWNKRFIGMNPHCMAFTYYDEEWYKDNVLNKIPNDVDILISHGPSWGLHDKNIYGEQCGSIALTKWCAEHISSLKLFVCGHIHEAYGKYDMRNIQEQLDSIFTPVFVNCSHVNERYHPVNKPVRVIL